MKQRTLKTKKFILQKN